MEVRQLPRGRHGLTREAVVGSQRERLLRAMADAVAANGYAKTTVADVLKRARVSRETFYEQFQNKEECFLAAYDAAAAIVAAEMSAALPQGNGAGASFTQRLDGLLRAYLEALAFEPALARTFMVEVYAAGPGALARRVEVQTRFAELVAAMAGARDARQRFACEALVAAVSSLVTQLLCADQPEKIPDLHEPLRDLAGTFLAGVGLGEQ